jgi:hypothetical protein
MKMKQIVLLSIVLHAVLLAVLGPVIKTRMSFDTEAEARRTAEVRKMEAERREQDRQRREKHALDRKTAENLKREAERQKREQIQQQVKQLRRHRDEMMELRDRELERFRQRSREEILAMEKAALRRMADRVAGHIAQADRQVAAQRLVVGAFTDEGLGLAGMLDDLSIHDRVLSAEEIAGLPGVVGDVVHRWDFEDGVVDRVGGTRGRLVAEGLIEERDAGGRAFRGNAAYGRAELGSFDLGERMTFSLWVKTPQLAAPQALLANAGNSGASAGLRLVVAGESQGKGVLVLSSNAPGAKRAEIRTVPGTLPLDRWAHVVVTVDKTEGEGAIYIDGRKADLVSAEVDPKAYTGNERIDGLKQFTDDVMKRITEETPSPESREQIDQELAAVGALVDEKLGGIRELDAVRRSLSEARDEIGAIRARMNGLDALTDTAAMNDTSTATADRMQVPPARPDGDPAQMYDEARALERQIAAAKGDVDAAREAAERNTSYQEARASAADAAPQRPDLSAALSGGPPATLGELNRFREDLHRAGSEVQDMNARAESVLGRESGREMSGSPFSSQAARSAAALQSQSFGEVVDMTVFGGGGGQGNSRDLRGDDSGEGAEMISGNLQQTLKLDEGQIIRAAMPGRRFTRDSDRKGWLYLDTWYVVGPWENHTTVDYSVKHPPEFGIDLDAIYRDGKFADRPGHPQRELKWEFYQSDQVRCQPPVVHGSSTYYAYTDVWFEEARDMLIAVASDDASSVWLNGEIVWQDAGQSAWQLGEGYRKVRFREGYNDVLVRIENGPSQCVWSVVLCPPEVLGE